MTDYSELEAILGGGEKVDVETAKGKASFSVHGLGLTEISILIENHRTVLQGAYETITADDGEPAAVNDMARRLLREAPEIAIDVIALGTRDMPPSTISKLPLDVQLDALSKTFTQTVSSGGGLGKLAEIVIGMFQSATSELDGLRT